MWPIIAIATGWTAVFVVSIAQDSPTPTDANFSADTSTQMPSSDENARLTTKATKTPEAIKLATALTPSPDAMNETENLPVVTVAARFTRTADINAAWISTFITFFRIEMALVGIFVTFGCIAFAVMQRRPRYRPEQELMTGPWLDGFKFTYVQQAEEGAIAKRNSLRPPTSLGLG